jgi:hypothetical protein
MSETCPVRGLELRYLLTVALLDHDRVLTIAELLHALDRGGFIVDGRPSKTVSDALRWEVRKGRVVRAGRGRYAAGRMPRSTQWWIRRRVASLREQLSLQRWQDEGSAFRWHTAR